MKRTKDKSREYYNARNGHSLWAHEMLEGGVRARVWYRGKIAASPYWHYFESFEAAVRHYTRCYGAWKRVEHIVGSIGW